MSTYWGFYCPKHYVVTDHILNHGEARLRELWGRRDDIPEALDFMAFVEADIPSYPFGRELVSFVSKHHDCPILLENEYGDRIPVDEVAPCSASFVIELPEVGGIKQETGELRCVLGEDHWGQHRHKSPHLLVEWT